MSDDVQLVTGLFPQYFLFRHPEIVRIFFTPPASCCAESVVESIRDCLSGKVLFIPFHCIYLNQFPSFKFFHLSYFFSCNVFLHLSHRCLQSMIIVNGAVLFSQSVWATVNIQGLEQIAVAF